VRNFIDINSHCFATDAQTLTKFRALLSNPALERLVLSSVDLKLDPSTDFPFMSCFAVSNEKLWEFVQSLDSPKVISWCHINPLDPDATMQLERWVKRGMQGVKMYPPRGFHVDDQRALNVFSAACDLDVPVFLHMGRTAAHPQLNSAYGHPLRLERVGLACPKLRLLIGHFAAPWSREAMHIAMGFSNFFFDLSTSGSWDLPLLREVCENEDAGLRRLIFGSNGDGSNNLIIAEKLNAKMRANGFGETELHAIFYENAITALNLT
jgi:predicted TIM-barrel fold metal-dependent hydrolase